MHINIIMIKNLPYHIISHFDILSTTIIINFEFRFIFCRANIAAAAGGIIFFMLYLPYSFMVVWEEALDPKAKTFSVSFLIKSRYIVVDIFSFFSASSPTSRLALDAPISPTMRKPVWGHSGTTSGSVL